MRRRFGSLFAGIGGFDLGLERAGMQCAWQVEIDEPCRSVLRRHFPDAMQYVDITKVGDDLEPVELICGGFPCQDLSVAGRREGLGGERSGLFHEFARVASALAPRWLLIENVPGLLSSNGGRDMGTVLAALEELGYGWAYRILNAQYFGVPQRRRRVFIVGCLGDPGSAAEILFESEGLLGNSPPSREERTEAPRELAACLNSGGSRLEPDDYLIACGDSPLNQEERENAAALTACGVGTCGPDDNQAQAGHLVANTLKCPTGGQHVETTYVSIKENQRAEVSLSEEYYHSLTTGGGKPGQGYPAIMYDAKVRKLTPTECERLQGFPDGWTEEQSDTPRYKQLGNAVAVPVAEWIGKRIMEAS